MTQRLNIQDEGHDTTVFLRALATGSFGGLIGPLLLGLGALTLALATMGNLGSYALLVGPLLAVGLLATRVLVEVASVLDTTPLASDSFTPLRSIDPRSFEYTGRR